MQKIGGTHLIVDAYVKDAASLQQENMLLMFDELVEQLDMRYLQKPQVMEVPLSPEKLSTNDDEGGYSYYCMITTSHISAHTWELRNAVMLDVFSCKPFNTDVATKVIADRLDFKYSRSIVVDREDPEMFGIASGR